MKILFLEHLFPLPPDSGSKIKSCFTIRSLASRHEVRLLSYVRGDDERRCIPEIEGLCSKVDVVDLMRSKARGGFEALSSLALGRSFIVSRDFRPQMLRAFHDAVEQFRPDVVHIDHLQMSPFADFDGRYKTVLDQHNVESVIVRRIGETVPNPLMRAYARIEYPRLRRYELNTCRQCDLVLTVSGEDRDTLRKMDPNLKNVEPVPIGIDTEGIQIVERNGDRQNALFLGTMYWPPNVDSVTYFCREIMPLVKKQAPDFTFTIAGQRPTAEVSALAADPSVKVTGYVKDTNEPARDCGVFVVPLRSGSGVRVKILTAMAMGLPIVSTTVGAEGLELTNGEHILLADDPNDFAAAVVKVLGDPELARTLGRNARELVCSKYSWDVARKRLLELYDTRLTP